MTSDDNKPREWDAILGLGSNIGDKRANIDAAIDALVHQDSIELVRRARDFVTPPWGNTDQDTFVNTCIAIKTELAPRPLLLRCQEVERQLGRVRKEKWGPRVIDVDVLAYRDVTLNDTDYVLPHPLIIQRAFVLVPLADIAPELRLSGRTVHDWLGSIDRSGVEVLPSPK